MSKPQIFVMDEPPALLTYKMCIGARGLPAAPTSKEAFKEMDKFLQTTFSLLRRADGPKVEPSN